MNEVIINIRDYPCFGSRRLDWLAWSDPEGEKTKIVHPSDPVLQSWLFSEIPAKPHLTQRKRRQLLYDVENDEHMIEVIESDEAYVVEPSNVDRMVPVSDMVAQTERESSSQMQVESEGEEPKILKQGFKIPETREEILLNWTLKHAPISAGNLKLRFLDRPSYQEAYYEYSKSFHTHLTFEVFLKYMHQWGIRSPSEKDFMCPHCSSGHLSTAEHYDLERQSRAQKIHQKMLLAGKAGIIVSDYSQFQEIEDTEIVIPTIGTRDTLKVSCLGLLLQAKDFVAPIDFFTMSKPCGEFLNEAFDRANDTLDELIDYNWDFIFWWADARFLQKSSLISMTKFQQRIMDNAALKGLDHYPLLQVNFFMPYHGDINCQKHFGRPEITTKQKKFQKRREKPRDEDILRDYPPQKKAPPEEYIAYGELIPESKQEYWSEGSLVLSRIKCVLCDPINFDTALLYESSLDVVRQTDPHRALLHQYEGDNPVPFVSKDPSKRPWKMANAIQKQYHS